MTHGIVPDDYEPELRVALTAHTFKDEGDWLAPPPSGHGEMVYCPIRFLAYLEHFGIEGGAPKIPDYLKQPSKSAFAKWEANGVADYTYFARGRYTGMIKIGRSKQPGFRISSLGSERNGEPADELIVLRDGSLEIGYHRVFERWRCRGEWFAPHPDIYAEIDRLKALEAQPTASKAPQPPAAP